MITITDKEVQKLEELIEELSSRYKEAKEDRERAMIEDLIAYYDDLIWEYYDSIDE